MILPPMISPPLRFSALLRVSAFTPCFLLRRGSAALRGFAHFCHTLFANVFLPPHPPKSTPGPQLIALNPVQSLNLAQKICGAQKCWPPSNASNLELEPWCFSGG